MRREFPGYYRPTSEEFKALWESAEFALDANVLLNVYGYSKPTGGKRVGSVFYYGIIRAIKDPPSWAALRLERAGPRLPEPHLARALRV